jgi:WD40 repeat protein
MPAVVAMQFEITDAAALLFSQEFYALVAEGHPIDAALAHARLAVYNSPNDIEWGTPVLYLRARDGRIFDLSTTGQSVHPDPPALDAATSTESNAGVKTLVDVRPASEIPGRRPYEATRPGGPPTDADREPEQVWRRVEIGQHTTCLAVSPEGTRAAIGGRRWIHLWDLETPRQMWKQAHGSWVDAVTSVAFSADGQRLATGGDNQKTRIWAVATGAQQLTIHHVTSRNSVPAVAFSPDGKRLATATYENIVIWDAATGQNQVEIRCPDARSMAFSPDGQRLAAGSRDHTAGVWDTRHGERQVVIRHDSLFDSVCFSRDGRRVATGSMDKTARIWDAATGRQEVEIPHDDHVVMVTFDPEGHRLATTTYTAGRVWDTDTGALLLEIRHNRSTPSVSFSPDGRRLMVGGSSTSDKQLVLWDALLP